MFALVGSTGVGKTTTTTAKLAAAFAAKHGASNLGLITLDAYRIGATNNCAPTAASSACRCTRARPPARRPAGTVGRQKLVLIDTAGMAQRDSRTQSCSICWPTRRIRRPWSSMPGRAKPSKMSAGRPPPCVGRGAPPDRRGRQARAGTGYPDPPPAKVIGVAKWPARARRLAPSAAPTWCSVRCSPAPCLAHASADVNLILPGAPVAEQPRRWA